MPTSKHFKDVIVNPRQQTATLTFSAVPDDGDFTLVVAGEETDDIAFDATTEDIKAALKDLDVLADKEVTVSGDFNPEMTIVIEDFQGTLEIGANTLEITSNPVTIAVVISWTYILDISCYKDMALSVAYPDNGGALELSLSGSTTDDEATMAELPDTTVTLGASAGTVLYNVSGFFFKYLQINVPELDSCEVRFQGMRFGL